MGLAAVVAELLGVGLAKEHSAVDWSTRPLPAEWLRYAALDVEVLIELRAVMADRLAEAGKAEWAAQEFEAVRLTPPPAPRIEPWRRVSGLHAIRDARRLAVVRELWEARDRNARERDISPGRVLPDTAIVAAAQALPRSVEALTALPAFSGKGARRRITVWQAAIQRGLATPDADLPSVRGPKSDAPPPPRAWADRDPAAAARLTAAREAIAALSAEHTVPVENLLQPDLLRRLCWTPPDTLDADVDRRRPRRRRGTTVAGRPDVTRPGAGHGYCRVTSTTDVGRAARAYASGLSARLRAPDTARPGAGHRRPAQEVPCPAHARAPPSDRSSSSRACAHRSGGRAPTASTPTRAPTTSPSRPCASCCAATPSCPPSASTRSPSRRPPRPATRG